MPGENYYLWSTTAVDNGNIDSLIDWQEGQTRASVNNSSRSELAAHAKNRDLLTGKITTGGSADAQTFVSGVGFTAVPANMRALLKIGPGLTNTGPATLNMDGIGDIVIKTLRGGDLGASALIADSYAEFLYNGTNWILLTTQSSQITINQTTIISSTSIVEFTEGFDGSYGSLTIDVVNLVPDIAATELWLQVSIDAGATWITAAHDYRWTRDAIWDGAYPPSWIGTNSTQYGGVPVGDQAVRLIGPWMGNEASVPGGCCVGGEIRLFAPHLAKVNMVQWHLSLKDSATYTDLYRGTGGYRPIGPINGVRLLASSGGIASGTFTMYGTKIA